MAKKRKKTRRKTGNREMYTQVKGILLLALAAFCYVGLMHTEQTGGLGKYVNLILRTLAGDAAIAVPFIIALFALWFILPLESFNIKTRLSGLLILNFIYMSYLHLQLITAKLADVSSGKLISDSLLLGLEQQGGGLIGALFTGISAYLIGSTGTIILMASLALIAALMIFSISIKKLFKLIVHLIGNSFKIFNNGFKRLFNYFRRAILNLYARLNNSTVKDGHLTVKMINEQKIDDADLLEKDSSELEVVEENIEEVHKIGDYQKERFLEFRKSPEKVEQSHTSAVPEVPGISQQALVNYKFPPMNLLSYPRTEGEQQQLKSSKNRAKLLENTLLSFGVKAKVIHVQSGPTVTRFEVQPEAGVKVSKIISLSDDLALNLAAPLVRIEAPIPGKAALGIEVPNKVIKLVHLREVMEGSVFRKNDSPLTIGLGKDITGNPVIADLTKMPHLLIAGATGAGKSVCLNTIITSILYKAAPDKVRFLMIDPKVVELSIYNNIPHLLMPVLTDPRKASLALRNMVREMARRYDLFASLGVRDISTYNELTAMDSNLEKLAFIVVIIDELADLMLVSPGEVEDSIARLTQMSRAAGIHLVVATQRPSVDVLTGIIKANITSRVAFTVSSQVDSRTILDMAGAEKLLGSGDMLFYPVGAIKPFRVQGAFVSEGELKRITDFIKEQGQIEQENNFSFMNTHEEIEEEVDALYAEAVDLVVRTGQASISLLQRRFRIGYTRAARLIDDLEKRSVVGPFEGSKPREVLITAEQAAQICEEFKQKNS